MNSITTLKDELTRLDAACAAEKLTAFDFDRVRETVRGQQQLLADYETLTGELGQLRQDYIDRIAAMARAVAAVNRRERNADELQDYLRSLAELTALELIEQYRLMAARFREAFPTSFRRR